MFLYDVELTLIGDAAIGAAQRRGGAGWSARVRTDASRRLMQDKGKLMGTAMNGLQMIETLKATGREAEFFARWAGYHAKSVNTAAVPRRARPDRRASVPTVRADARRRRRCWCSAASR